MEGRVIPAPKYVGLGLAKGKEVLLDAATAYCQAAQALDAAADIAVASADAEQLTTVAALWMKIGEELGISTEDEEEHAHDVSSKKQGSGDGTLGFNNLHLEEDEDESE